jgi:hypothetical protein
LTSESVKNPSLIEIGNVSMNILPFHEKHRAVIVSEHPALISISMFDLTYNQIELVRRYHPFSHIRTEANIFMGINRFCFDMFRKGPGETKNRSEEAFSIEKGGTTIHQREINMAVKLSVLAVAFHDPVYGIKYVQSILSTKNYGEKFLMRVLRIYKLISCIQLDIQTYMKFGLLKLNAVEAIKEELVIREKIKYKYKMKKSFDMIPPELLANADALIDMNLDGLFNALNKFATDQAGELMDQTNNDEVQLTFDIDVNAMVDSAIENLKLSVDSNMGFIDIGDTDLYQDE